jgi:hypothetical protein
LLAAGVPAAFGAVCGWVLGVNEIAYLVLSLLALIGAYVAGREHVGALEAAARGAVAGVFFGGALLLVHKATGKAPKADLPDPEILLLAVTTVVSMFACAFGGADRKSLEERDGGPRGFSLKRLHWSEPLGFLGSAVLVGSLWLPWFSTNAGNPNSIIGSAGIGPGQSATGWETFVILDILFVVASVAPFILAYLVARDADLSWRPGEVTMIVGITCVVLVLCNGLILGKPKPGIEISLNVGWYVGLLGAAGIFASGFLRQALHVDAKQPPGVM